MEEDSNKSPWENVLEFTKMAQKKEIDTMTWAIRVSSILGYFNIPLPCPELAEVLVAHICWDNNVPVLWKYLEKVMSSRIVPPMFAIALLSTRVFPIRGKNPIAYRLYMEILKRYCFDFTSQMDPNFKRIRMMVDDVLHLSKRFGAQAHEQGVFEVEYIFCILWQLLDATLEDEGLLDSSLERIPNLVNGPHDMELDIVESIDQSKNEYYEKLVKENTTMAIEVIDQFLHHKVICRLLSLIHQNMPCLWKRFSQCLQMLASNSLALKNSTVSPDRLINWSFDIVNKKFWKFKSSKYRELCPISSGPFESPGGHCHGPSRSAIWVPLDLYLEDAVDGSISATNAIETISGLLKVLQTVNRTTWHEAFLGLWMASLRLVQRIKDLIEGPVPYEDARMCLLLSITTLSIADVINEEKCTTNNQTENSNISQLQDTVLQGERHRALVHSLQLLGNYESLLVPPPSFIYVANQAAAKALAFVSGIPISVGFFESIGTNNKLNCSGNMWHLIVEACIARNLLDTSAYLWPGYVNDHTNQIPQNTSDEGSDWSALMEGAKLTTSMMKIPASSLPELEKVFEIAASGSDNDRISAAAILCSASLIRGWNIQEYTVCFVVKLLSPSVPAEYSSKESHLISHAPVLDVVLAGISSVDCVQIFSFHGLVPELAAALMAICEVFGSCASYAICVLPTGEEVTPHTIFSNAFILLMRLWEFNHTPLEYILMGDGARVGSQLTPEYLLLLHNSKIMISCNNNKKNIHQKLLRDKSSTDLVYMDTFPKWKVWYSQHQACLASTLSGLTSGTPVCLIVDNLLSMMFRKVDKGAYQTCSVTSGGSNMNNSSIPGSEEAVLRPKLPAWDILEAIPYVVDATLTACAHGKLSPRELATGLKDLVDFLPASLATIISYFSAEVTRGVWKPADMNGTDWPSPAANLSTVEEKIRKIIAGTGVDVPSLGKALDSPTTLPLPLAAFVSLTITYKLDKASSRFLNLAGPALENLSASCPWPSMAIVTALWTQKVKRWSNFLTFSASRTVFHHNNYAVSQILKSCFASILGLSQTPGSECGVGNLLGHGLSCDSSGGLSPVAPGILFLRTYRSSRDVLFLTEEIISLLMLSVRQVTDNGISDENAEKLTNSKHGVRYGHTSLISSFTQVKTAASVGATFVWLSGGCGLIQCMFREIFPSWFLSVRDSDQGQHGGMVAMLEGYVLAYFAVLCGMFAWGVDIEPTWRLRPKIVRVHLEFMADALDGKVSLGCSWETWCAYVSAFIGLVLDCVPNWLLEVDLEILTRLSHHLRHYDEEELAILLLSKSGAHAMGAAAEIIIKCQ